MTQKMKKLIENVFSSSAVKNDEVTDKTIRDLMKAKMKTEYIQKKIVVRTAECEREICVLLSLLSQCRQISY